MLSLVKSLTSNATSTFSSLKRATAETHLRADVEGIIIGFPEGLCNQILATCQEHLSSERPNSVMSKSTFDDQTLSRAKAHLTTKLCHEQKHISLPNSVQTLS